ncbi:anthranilate synthase component I family protein [Parasediminibacterium sp. JCM 36343]|uniref:anthranilate synthase component I family protein n=1 Tax=Parasediminibacterium sp. JCM 36343 TaxID=3374279 RepID=UPI00397DB0C5
MQRKTRAFPITNFQEVKQQLLYWANQYSSCSFLDSHHYVSVHQNVECLVGVGAINTFYPQENGQQALQEFIDTTNDWLFGHIAYDYKDVLNPALASNGVDKVGFEKIHFFQPEIVLQLSLTELRIESLTEAPETIFQRIIAIQPVNNKLPQTSLNIKSSITKKAYLHSIEKLRQHILRGDCYELNFCQEFFATNAVINPLDVYNQLMQLSPNPFSCYYKNGDKYLLCASPERYLQKKDCQLISQPIKGTFKRDIGNAGADSKLKHQLYNSSKERAENVMVVDLVRNDLSKICKEGSVAVTELFGIYTFPQVHQMISTIAGEIKDGIGFSDILAATFPMGSMTGAPKKRVMELINQYEAGQRGLYAGAVGYIAPNGDFDFNVVIRSILYNATNQYLSYQVGGGITFYSNAEEEYKECLLKAEAIRRVLG